MGGIVDVQDNTNYQLGHYPDLRFVEDEKELGYWIEDYDAGAKTAKIWVNVSNIPANGEAKIKMYYEKDKAGSVSDGDATFEFLMISEERVLTGINGEKQVEISPMQK